MYETRRQEQRKFSLTPPSSGPYSAGDEVVPVCRRLLDVQSRSSPLTQSVCFQTLSVCLIYTFIGVKLQCGMAINEIDGKVTKITQCAANKTIQNFCRPSKLKCGNLCII